MRILVIGLDGAAPELMFGDEQLTNVRRLMEYGCYGQLESIVPPSTVPAWMCMVTSQDPGSLGVYGPRNRMDYSYNDLKVATSEPMRRVAVWDQVVRQGGRAIIVGVPPSCPEQGVKGFSVGSVRMPDASGDMHTPSESLCDEIANLVGEHPLDVTGLQSDNRDQLKDEIPAMTRRLFAVARHLIAKQEWDYFQFVESGLERLQHSFWGYQDPQQDLYEPGNPYRNVIRDYYRYLDDELGTILELLDDDTVVSVISDHGVQGADGGFCVNEWLLTEGLLVLDEYPQGVTPFSSLKVNWKKTKVWGAGGDCAPVFFNVMGREGYGAVTPADYDEFRDWLKAKFEATMDAEGRSMGTLVFKPEEIYRTVHNVAPDLMVRFGGLWRSIGTVGHSRIHLQVNDAGLDGCSHSQFGSLILTAWNNPLQGEVQGAHLLDVAPTLLELGGYDIPRSMQGKSLVAGKTVDGAARTALPAEDEDILRERLSGLGYIS